MNFFLMKIGIRFLYIPTSTFFLRMNLNLPSRGCSTPGKAVVQAFIVEGAVRVPGTVCIPGISRHG